jgi:hypothetical protein
MSVITSGLPFIYRPDKAHVWVEDIITEQYLSEIWQDSSIVFHVGGGNQTIRAVAHAAVSQGHPNVLGIIDRDYGQTNFNQWTNPASTARVLSLPVHELENYLLDSDALAGCVLNNLGRTPAAIDMHIRHVAGLYEWQVSAAQVIAEWRDAFQSDFPAHPSRVEAADNLTTQAYLQGAPWYAALSARANTVTAAGEPATTLAVKYAMTNTWLLGGDWKERFPGKEIFRDVRGYIYDPAALGALAGGIQPDTDVAKAVATWQRNNTRIPPALQALQTVIHTKTGV